MESMTEIALTLSIGMLVLMLFIMFGCMIAVTVSLVKALWTTKGKLK